MDILGFSAIRSVASACLALMLASTAHAQFPDGVTLMPGLQLEVIYDVAFPDPLGLGERQDDMAIDPLTGNLAIANTLTGVDGNILLIDPKTRTARTIDFPSQALDFAPDGTLYFGVSNLMLGVWFRDSDTFRKFATIPSVRGVFLDGDGRLFVGEGDFGPPALAPEFRDAILQVDRQDAFFAPVVETDGQIEPALESAFNVVTAMTGDSNGNLYLGYHTGEMVKARGDGSFAEINRRMAVIGGLNEFPLGAGPDGLVFQYDVASGSVFAIDAAEHVHLLAFGDALRGRKFSNGGVVADANNLYLVSDNRQLLRLHPPAEGSLKGAILADRGDGEITGTVRDQSSGETLGGVTVRLQSGQAVTTEADGAFAFHLPVGLYEMTLSLENFRSKVVDLEVRSDQALQLSLQLDPGLPGFLAPGLAARITANRGQDGINGAADAVLDREGNLYSMNFGNGTITQIFLDPDTRLPTASRIYARGGALRNSFIVFVDDAGAVWASNGNLGLYRLPPDHAPYTLTTDAADETIVRDQNGVNRRVSLVSDVDGITARADGTLMLSSGASGAPTPGFPGGTFNTIVSRRADGVEAIFSTGRPAGGGDPLWSNNDILKAIGTPLTGRGDILYVGDRNGNAIQVNPDGSARLIWPGDGAGKPDGLGPFTGLNDDGQGHLFLRGATGDGSDNELRAISPDGNELLVLAAGLDADFGGFEFDRKPLLPPPPGSPHSKHLPLRDAASAVHISDNNVVITIFSLDGRSLYANLTDPPPTARFKRMARARGDRANQKIRVVDLTPGSLVNRRR